MLFPTSRTSVFSIKCYNGSSWKSVRRATFGKDGTVRADECISSPHLGGYQYHGTHTNHSERPLEHRIQQKFFPSHYSSSPFRVPLLDTSARQHPRCRPLRAERRSTSGRPGAPPRPPSPYRFVNFISSPSRRRFWKKQHPGLGAFPHRGGGQPLRRPDVAPLDGPATSLSVLVNLVKSWPPPAFLAEVVLLPRRDGRAHPLEALEHNRQQRPGRAGPRAWRRRSPQAAPAPRPAEHRPLLPEVGAKGGQSLLRPHEAEPNVAA